MERSRLPSLHSKRVSGEARVGAYPSRLPGDRGGMIGA